MLNKESKLPYPSFFTIRLSDSRSTVSENYMQILKDLIKSKYDVRKRETRQLINEIDNYIKFIAGGLGPIKSHTYEFLKIYPFQMKNLIDITKGLNPLTCEFFIEDELATSVLKGGVTRQHTQEDPEYNYILCLLEDGAFPPTYLN